MLDLFSQLRICKKQPEGDGKLSSLRSIQDIEFILALQEDPLADYKDIVTRLGVTYQTVSRRLRQLRQEKAFRVNADLDLEALNKEGAYFFISSSKLKNIKILEQLAEEHPYTAFRGRYLSQHRGIYMEFSIPAGTRQYVRDLLEELKSRNIVEDYSEQFPARICRTATQVYAWDGHDWSFDWEGFEDTIDVASTSLNELKPANNQDITTNLGKLSLGDLKLLAEITRDAGLKNKELATRAGVYEEEGYQQGYQLSRKIKWLRETFVEDYRLFMDKTVFNIFNLLCFRCKSHLEDKNRLFNLLESSPEEFPFQSTLHLTEDGFTWYVACPSSHFSPLSKFIWNLSEETELYVIDYNSVSSYYLWHETFDPEKKYWKKDRDYMVGNVLKAVLGTE